MGAIPRPLHVAFFPLMAPGHTIPLLDIVTLFAARKVKTSILTTPLNAPNITKYLPIDSDFISIEVVLFPDPQDTGLHQGLENFENVTSHEMATKFMLAMNFFKQPLERFLGKTQPDCLVADLFFPFATDVAANFGIPRLVFHGTSFFAMCLSEVLMKCQPQKSVSLDDEPFLIPQLPHKIELTKSQMQKEQKEGEESDIIAAALEAESKSFGVIFNSFYELEPDYADYYRKMMGKKAWHIGPVSLSNKHIGEKCKRGKPASVNGDVLLKWLDSKEPSSVIYVCFGSLANFSSAQLQEIAMALETSGQPFIWVVKKGKEQENQNDEWLPKGFEKRMEGKGLIIRGWAPQVMILGHNAVGGFVTHCGWNSILEAVSAGIPMVTWPRFAEQFFNEKLVTDVLKIGVKVGSKQWNPESTGPVLKLEEIDAALKKIMVGKEASEMKSRVKNLKAMASEAVEEGGSSFRDLSVLIQELSFNQPND